MTECVFSTYHLKLGEQDGDAFAVRRRVAYACRTRTIRSVRPDVHTLGGSRARQGVFVWRDDTLSAVENVGATESGTWPFELKPCSSGVESRPPPNPRVQRTRSSPSARSSPLTRHPLGGS